MLRNERAFIPSPRISMEPSLDERSRLIPYSNSPYPNLALYRLDKQKDLKFDFEIESEARSASKSNESFVYEEVAKPYKLTSSHSMDETFLTSEAKGKQKDI